MAKVRDCRTARNIVELAAYRAAPLSADAQIAAQCSHGRAREWRAGNMGQPALLRGQGNDSTPREFDMFDED